MLLTFGFVFLTTTLSATVSQVVSDTCPSEAQIEAARQSGITASIDDLVLGGVIPSDHPCGSGTWIRAAYLNLSDPLQKCPSGWREYTEPIRSCGRPVTNSGSCLPTFIQIDNYEYSHICGQIIGYQVSTPDAFNHDTGGTRTIDNAYVDGISLTHGSPRQHIWTFAAGSNEFGDRYGCFCGGASEGARAPLEFVGSNYFCESARDAPGFLHAGFFPDDPLWDGMGCAITNCCDFNTPPWFRAQLPSPTTDDIEVRLCMDQSTGDEDVAIELWEIYVQ